MKIPFGKYMGKTVEEIAGSGDDGLKYLDWLRGQDWFVKKTDLFEAVEEYLNKPEVSRALDLAIGD